MDVNQKRQPSPELRKLFKHLILQGNRIELLGSAGLQSQQYNSDYDLFSVVKQTLTPEEAYNECIRILDGVQKEPNIFFIEYKIQRKDGSKTKFYPDTHSLQGRGLFSSISNAYNTVKNKVSSIIAPVSKQNFTFNPDFPPLSVMYQVIDNSYRSEDRDASISGYDLIYSTPTLVFYKKENMILVGVRGTADARDTRADLLIPLGLLHTSARYVEDIEVMKQIHQQYSNCIFYGVGHSLGGALVDRFLQAGLLNQAVSYNPAVEKGYFDNTKNKRIYISTDALYNTMGRFASNVEVRPQPNQSLLKKVLTNTSGVGLAYKTVSSHLLSNFVGGKKKGSLKSHNYRDKTAFISAFRNVDYIKKDFIVRIKNVFKELSIIYSFSKKEPANATLAHDLNTEIEDNIQGGNYYKALKRLFSLYKVEEKNKDQLPLSRFFNSYVGKVYEMVSNLKALQLLLSKYEDRETEKKVKINMKDLHLVPRIDLIDKYMEAYQAIIQREAKILWDRIGKKDTKTVPKKITVVALRKIVKDKGLSRVMKGYTRWKKDILLIKLKEAGHI